MQRKAWATFIVVLIALPMVFLFTGAVADARQRALEGPFRALVGNGRFDELMEGRGGFPHYLGSRLSAPDFTLPQRNGEPWTLSEHRGKVIVMNFWTVTCKPCIQEMPTIETLAQIAENWDDVEVVAVSTDQSWAEVNAVIERESRITHLLDSETKVVTDRFGTKLYPETWIIDGDGLVRFRYDGALDWSNPVTLDLIRAYR